ncbi:hypothetical protein A6V39_04285 [Candidatus Mycoplasma haematobovis]|uniref:Uncharacterized protein n=1 Tax=Candidatus Mycoplasma haematobovis TaxID=432608 RepID=A0A1A9QDT3_9MOLU|nr:hypothetical protein [Candidatus Mycoplasma haematobovis]OAL10105.1 hypothetical protein A6V39_04285 [Candidatus Mycoplasma haematobovis]
MKKLNNLEKNKYRGGGSWLGIIQGAVALVYTIGEILNFSASWIPEKKSTNKYTPPIQNEPKAFINRNDDNQITIFS